jgi:hypothetical protein
MSKPRKYSSVKDWQAAQEMRQAYAAHVDALFDRSMAYEFGRHWRTLLSREQIEYQYMEFRRDRNEWLRKHRHRAGAISLRPSHNFSYGPKPEGLELPPLE